MIGRWPTLLLLLLLSVCNTIYIYSHFFSSHKVLFCFCVCSLQFFFRVFDGILASHFAPLTFYKLFLPRGAFDARRLLDQSSFREYLQRVFLLFLSRTLSSERERERERERSQHSLSSLSLSKSPRHQSIERLFFRLFALKKDTNTGCFLHQKKKVFKSLLNARAKILAHKKHARTRFKKNDNNKSAEQRERELQRV